MAAWAGSLAVAVAATLVGGCEVVFSLSPPGTPDPDGGVDPDGAPGTTDAGRDAGGDASACAPGPEDEDLDALADACDPCPHVAGPPVDADLDGVGDACDRHVQEGSDAWVLFDGWNDLDLARWTPNGGSWSVAGGELVSSATTLARLHRATPVDVPGVIEAELELPAMVPATQQIAGLELHYITTSSVVCVAINEPEPTTAPRVAIYQWTSAGGLVMALSQGSPVVRGVPFRIRFGIDAGEAFCEVDGVPVVITGPVSFGDQRLLETGLFVQNGTVHARYTAIIGW
jgi:hypothetical protein